MILFSPVVLTLSLVCVTLYSDRKSRYTALSFVLKRLKEIEFEDDAVRKAAVEQLQTLDWHICVMTVLAPVYYLYLKILRKLCSLLSQTTTFS
jgi:hypothetical protein